MTDFHFLRPLWLYGIPLLLVSGLLYFRLRAYSNWENYIPRSKLDFLLVGDRPARAIWRYLLLVGWMLACIGLAGPSWERIPVPVVRDERALVIALDLSPSMLAQDVTPDRLTLAKFKLIDVLRARGSGQTALIAYAGDPHTVAPLTDDVRTIESLLPALHPRMMPEPGSNTEDAVRMATGLLGAAGLAKGDILLITDGVAPAVRLTLRNELSGSYRLLVLGLGTAEGAPIPDADGGFVHDRQGDIVLARLDAEELRRLAEQHHGRFAEMRTDGSDIAYLLGASADDLLDGIGVDGEPEIPDDLRYDSWYDQGYWVILVLLPLAAMGFRRGVLLVFVAGLILPGVRPLAQDAGFTAGPTPSQPVARSIWDALWSTRDQHASLKLQDGDPAGAASLFRSPAWSGYAHYRNGDYASAEAQFRAGSGEPIDYYNLGNALAMRGKLEEAIESYQQALAQDPSFEDAEYNKAIVEKILDQQQQQQQQQGGEQQTDNDQQQSSDAQSQQAESSEQSESGAAQQQADQRSEEYQDTQQHAASEDQSDSSDATQNQLQAQPQAADQALQDSEMSALAAAEPTPEQLQESSEQWLRGIPDDPSGLLRRKFEYETEQNRQQRRFMREQPIGRPEERF